MKSSSYLVVCNNRAYSFRLVVPEDLRPQFGQREIRRSLRTRDHREAQILAWKMADGWKTLFRRARMQRIGLEPGFYNQITFAGLVIEDNALRADRMEIDPSHAEEELLLLDRILDKVSRSSTSQESNECLLSKLFEQYAADRVAVNDWSSSTEKEHRTTFAQLLNFLGDKDAGAVDRQDARRLLTSLKQLRSHQGKPYSCAAINKKLGLLSSLYKWAAQEHLVDKNPFQGLQLKDTRRDDQKKGIYSNQELQQLFASEIFVINTRKPSRYWIPLICAYSGCRIGEAAQLRIDSFKIIDDVWCMEFDATMRLKTPNAQRLVPLHDELLRLGLLCFVEQKKAKHRHSNADTRLFTELRQDSARAGGAISNFWNHTHHKHAAVTRTEVSFHSLRHGFETRLRIAGVPETIAAELVGHERGSGIGYCRYAKPGQIQPLVEAIKAIDYGSLLAEVPVWE